MARGFSPLLITGALLIISISIGAAVMSFGEEFIEQHGEVRTPSCDNSAFTVLSIEGKPHVCTRNSELYIFIENSGSSDITGFDAQLIGSVDVQSTSAQTIITPGQAARVSMSIPQTLGRLLQLRLTPRSSQGKCEELTQSLSQISMCT